MEQPLPNGRGSDGAAANAYQTRNRTATVRERFSGNAPTPIEIEELGRLEVPLGAISGYQLVQGERTTLPIGSSLKRGVFYWQPGPGFLGDYTLVFGRPDGTEAQLHVKIRPKTYPPVVSPVLTR
jgi:hypothetical protein